MILLLLFSRYDFHFKNNIWTCIYMISNNLIFIVNDDNSKYTNSIYNIIHYPLSNPGLNRSIKDCGCACLCSELITLIPWRQTEIFTVQNVSLFHSFLVDVNFFHILPPPPSLFFILKPNDRRGRKEKHRSFIKVEP